MEVILLENIGNLGTLGDKVDVKPGYGRNFLIPQGKAVPATEDNVAKFEARRAELEATAAETLSAAEARGEALAALDAVEIAATAGEEGKLFGSVGTRDIADALTAAGCEVDKSEVRLPEGVIRELGEFEIMIQVHAEVSTSVAIHIVAEQCPAGFPHRVNPCAPQFLAAPTLSADLFWQFFPVAGNLIDRVALMHR